MPMDYIKEQAKKVATKAEDTPPDWVSKSNATFKAWEYVEEQRIKKAEYIKSHSKAKDFPVKKYQISGTEIANAVKTNRSSLMNTSTFSAAFSQYLDEVNKDLATAKDKKLEKAKNPSARGTIRSNKPELVRANTNLRNKIDELEALKLEEIVARSFDKLPLPIKKKLGIS